MISLLILFALLSFDTPRKECDCLTDFKGLVKTYIVEKDFFHQQLHKIGESTFETYTEKLSEQAAQLTTISECQQLKKEWLLFLQKESAD